MPGSERQPTSGRRSSGRSVVDAWSRPSSSRSARRSMRRPGSARSSPMIAGRSSASSAATCTRCPRCARRSPAASIRWESCSTRRRRDSAGFARPCASPMSGFVGGSTRSWARSSGMPSRSRSSRCATVATSSRSSRRRGRGSRASSTTHRAAARRCSSSPSWPSSSGTPGARPRSPRPRRSRASSTSCRPSSRPTPSHCAKHSGLWRSSTCGRPRHRWRPRCAPPGPRPPTGPRRSCCRPATPG